MIRRIAVLTGDNNIPGMNAAIRAVTRTALHQGWEVIGICDGFTGLAAGEFIPLTARTVDALLQQGGTMLGGTDHQDFAWEMGRRLALDQLAKSEIDALIVIGAGESQAGAYALSRMGFAVNGVAASIENDFAGFDQTLGVDTALNVALEAIDHLKKSKSKERSTVLVEVAGCRCGYLALMTGIAGGADIIVIPEADSTPEQIADAIQRSHERGQSQAVIVVAEGVNCNVYRLLRHFAQEDPLRRDIRDTRLGHRQRHAAPSGFDRLLATRSGVCAVNALARGEHGIVSGLARGEVQTVPFAEVVGRPYELDSELIQLAKLLSIENHAAAQAH
jgi:6-phosphofructokinase 1